MASLLERPWIRGLGVSIVAGGFLAFSGAFGSIGAPLWWRLLYWIPLIIAGGFWSQICSRIVEQFIDTEARPWVGIAALSLLMSVPVTIMVWAATALLFWQRIPQWHVLPDYFLPVLAVVLPLCAINVFLERRQPVETHAAPSHAPARFLQRLPAKLRNSRLLAVQSEDHYLRLYTDKGSDLILMRLSDALEELDGLEGAQTHRSWWVAKDAVAHVSRGDGRASLTLFDGTIAPVSRRYARALREAGWW